MKKIILDCDPGMDDSMAIIMAAKSPDVNLLAVTTVNGNYPVEITSLNALKVLQMLGRTDIPVAKGMSCPMVREKPSDPFTHGADGQAEANLPRPVAQVCKEHAVTLIIDLIKQNPGEITVVSTGPMSNIAMAIRMVPEIKPLIKEIIAISGAFGLNEYSFLNATGDTPQSEWNVYVDPESAKIVYESGIPLTAIGLDVATYFDIDFSEGDILEFSDSTRKEAQFFANAIKFVRDRGYSAYCACIDCMAVACAIDSSIVRTEQVLVGIETKDGLSLGMTIRDGRHHHIWNDLPSISIAKTADYIRFLNLLKELVLV
jgi:purine nucleosidase/pyrimidine-specific ribonucleoside hydrolase